MHRQTVAGRHAEQVAHLPAHDDPRRLIRRFHQLHQQIVGQQVQDRLQQSHHRVEQRRHDVRQQVREEVQDVREQIPQQIPQQTLPRGEIHGRQAEDHRKGGGREKKRARSFRHGGQVAPVYLSLYLLN